MRVFVDLVALAMLLALIAGGVAHRRVATRQEETIEAVRADVRRIEQTLHLKAATGEVEVNGRGWPVEIDPAWFGKNPPRNGLLSANRPWLEIAPISQASLTNPPIRVAGDETIASFWYNPANGVVRARIGVTISDKKATALYNRINHESLWSIFDGLDEIETPPPTDVARAPKMADASAERHKSKAKVRVSVADESPPQE